MNSIEKPFQEFCRATDSQIVSKQDIETIRTFLEKDYNPVNYTSSIKAVYDGYLLLVSMGYFDNKTAPFGHEIRSIMFTYFSVIKFLIPIMGTENAKEYVRQEFKMFISELP